MLKSENKLVKVRCKMKDKKIFYFSGKTKLCGVLNQVNDTKKIVVICHARTSHKDSNSTLLLANALSQANINNFRFDFIACGESEGDISDYTVTNMVANLNDTLLELQKDFNFKDFILIGCSMGARIVSLVDYKKFNIEKIILWYGALNYYRRIFNLPSKKEKIAEKKGYYEIEKGKKLSYNYFVDERKYVAYKKLFKWDVPKLFIHGTKDQYVNYKSSVKISKRCRNSKLILIQNGDHGFHDEKTMNLALQETINFIQNDSLSN